MHAFLVACALAFANPVSAVEVPKVTIEAWEEEEYLYYISKNLPEIPVDPAAAQIFTIPTAHTLAPKTVRVSNSMLVFSQANAGLFEGLQAGVANAFFFGMIGDLKYRFLKLRQWSAAVQAGGGYVVNNRTSFGFARLLSTYSTTEYRISAAMGYGGGEYRQFVNYRGPRGVHLMGASLGGDVRVYDYLLFMAEANWAGVANDPREGDGWYVVAGPRFHGKQVAFDLGMLFGNVRNQRGISDTLFPWVGLSWLDF